MFTKLLHPQNMRFSLETYTEISLAYKDCTVIFSRDSNRSIGVESSSECFDANRPGRGSHVSRLVGGRMVTCLL